MTKIEEQYRYRTLWNECFDDYPGSNELYKWMEEHGFFEAPASSTHHLNRPGGLCRHSINVAMEVISLCKLRAFEEVDKIEAVRAALLHDLCKLDDYGLCPDTGKYTCTSAWCLGHGEESAILALRFIKLSVEEIAAIRWHMGAYSGRGDWNALGKAYEQYPMALLLHLADMIATYRDEAKI